MKQNEIRIGLTFNDVLLVPKKTIVSSRQETIVKTQFSKHLKLNIPIVTANMDTVTESTMAIAISREGGLGIIHRFLTIDQQVEEVAKVKRWSHVVITDPYTVTPETTLAQVQADRERLGSSSFIVVDVSKKVLGILTSRDTLFEDDMTITVDRLMTPAVKLISATPGITLEAAKALLHQHRLEKLPLLTADGKLAGLITLKDVLKRERFPLATIDAQGRLLVGAAIGVKDDFIERSEALINAGVDVLVLDVAHGHADQALRAIAAIREKFGNVELVAGNVATAEAVSDLAKAGVDAIKVGVGPGAACTTRIVTGAGVPQLTAIMDCAEAARQYDLPLIADGGIQTSGDVVKALAAGASTVMCGNLFAGTDESPGTLVTRNGQKVKVFRGMASRAAAKGRSIKEQRQIDDTTFNEMVPEGVEAVVPYRGSVRDIVNQLIGGLRSGLSYSGSRTIEELHERAEFIQITAAGWHESKPHDAEVTS